MGAGMQGGITIRGALAFLFIALFALALAPGSAHAQRPETSEASVKAAFLYKFGGYVEWSPDAFTSPDASLVIAVLGSDAIAAELAKIVPGRSIDGHPVVVRKLREGESARGAHLLFAGRMDPSRLQPILRAAQKDGVLAVTEMDKGLEMGAVINFVTAEDRVGFEVSLDNAEKCGQRISSRMLTVARRVIPKAP